MLTFVPHLRDLESNEEKRYSMWLQELEEIDRKSGFKPMNRTEKYTVTLQTERAAQISPWLDDWLERLAIPHCSKAALLLYLIPQFSEAALPDYDDLTKFYANGLDEKEAVIAAEFFVGALNLAFKQSPSHPEYIDMRRVLRLYTHSITVRSHSKEEERQQIVDEDEDEKTSRNLATYSILGCLICNSHSCQHGEYNDSNYKCNFSISSRDVEGLRGDIAFQRKRRLNMHSNQTHRPCHRECYREPDSFELDSNHRPWSDADVALLQSVLVSQGASNIARDPICFIADYLDRYCSDVHRKLQDLDIKLDTSAAPEGKPRMAKTLPWYDRHRKLLIGDWQDHTLAHEHQQREWFEPCVHEGPCDENCSCVMAGLLCEKHCRCTVEECSYKFTGCSCHSHGKTCQAKQKDRGCICVQLNRECDPDLCGSCGAVERADASNADVPELYATGCQNCDLQRGVPKIVALGKSQLEGVGYGLFAAEGINQDDFVIEYVGELITHDEGVRREARRGDVFSYTSDISYVFTLLEKEGIWVDAAVNGNLSRYINHAVERCNITPQILYVNGEYRIKFTAMRNIDAGEELFFNYGENFPNLTKKLLDTKTGYKADFPAKKLGRPRRSESRDGVARKQPKVIPITKIQQQAAQKRQSLSRLRREVVPDSADESQSYDNQTKDDDSQRDSLAERASVEQDGDNKSSLPIRPANSPITDRPRRTLKRKRDEFQETASEYEVTDQRKRNKAFHQTRDATSMPADSATATDQDGSTGNSPSTDRMRTRESNRAGREEDSPARRDSDKTRGNRGGARPGSGRPRKHPKNTPRASTAAEVPSTTNTANIRTNRRTSRIVANRQAIVISDSEDDVPFAVRNERSTLESGSLDDHDDQEASEGLDYEDEASQTDLDEGSDDQDAPDYGDDEEDGDSDEAEEGEDGEETGEEMESEELPDHDDRGEGEDEDEEDEEHQEGSSVIMGRTRRSKRLPAKFRDASL